MALGNYINIPASATVGGAPIDAFQGDAFRQNDLLFEQALRSLAYNLLPLNNGVDGPVNFVGATDKTKIWRTTTATISTAISAAPGIPLIIMASSTTGVAGSGTITLSNTITAAGLPGAVGHLGGSGGGGSAGAGQNTVMPVLGTTLAVGGPVGANNGTTPANTNHFLRALPILPLLAGGGAGGASSTAGVTGGVGGGVVVLIADTINWTGGTINASGAVGSGAGGGGGGGGAIIMIAKTFTPSVPTISVNFAVTGGATGGAGAGAGGAGLLLTLTLP